MAVIRIEEEIGVEIVTSRGERDFGGGDSTDWAASLEVSVINLDETPKQIALRFEGYAPNLSERIEASRSKPGQVRTEYIRHGQFFLVKKDKPRDDHFRLRGMEWYLKEVTVTVGGRDHTQTRDDHVSAFSLEEEEHDQGGFGFLAFILVLIIVMIYFVGT